MKKLITIAALTILSVFTVVAQNGKIEQEILTIHNSLDEAYLKQDVAVFERVLADDYVNSSPTGKMLTRVASLENLRKEFADKNYKTSGFNFGRR